jgi:FAD/FMN-containing dehydrogenase
VSGDPLLARLSEIVGDTQVLTGAEDVKSYATDWRGRYFGVPRGVVRPASTQEVAQVVRCCAQAGVPMVPQGGNTGLCGGATPIGNEVLISLTRLNRVRHTDPLNNAITVEAGCPLQRVQEAAADAGRLFPLSLAAEGTATIGGNLSTNAGGVQVLRYGNTRDLTLGLEVVLPSGEIWDGLRALRKDNTGYDMKHLFIGAEGTLGLITAATLKLFPRPKHVVTAWGSVSSPMQAVQLLGYLRDRVGDSVTAFELISSVSLELVMRHIPGSRLPLAGPAPWQFLVEFSSAGEMLAEVTDAFQEAMRDALIGDVVIAGTLTQAQALWAMRENISEAQKREGVSIKHDVSMPIPRIAEFIARANEALTTAFPEIRIVCFGHIGDGNLHYNLSKPRGQGNEAFIAATHQVNRVVHDLVTALGGSISAEHGIGQLKREEILRYKSPVEMEMMRAVKSALDPQRLMNPGKLFARK